MAKRLHSIDQTKETVSPALIARISAHMVAAQDFRDCCGVEEQAGVNFRNAFEGKLYAGSFGTSFDMSFGSDWVKEQISSEVLKHKATVKKALAHVAPELLSQAVATLEATEADHHAAIEAAFAAETEKRELVTNRYFELSGIEDDALRELCAFVCHTPEEYRMKGDYLLDKEIRYSISVESGQLIALLESMRAADGEPMTAQRAKNLAPSAREATTVTAYERLWNIGNEMALLLKENPDFDIYRITVNEHGVHTMYNIPGLPASSGDLTDAILAHEAARQNYHASRDGNGDLMRKPAEAEAYSKSAERFRAAQCHTLAEVREKVRYAFENKELYEEALECSKNGRDVAVTFLLSLVGPQKVVVDD